MSYPPLRRTEGLGLGERTNTGHRQRSRLHPSRPPAFGPKSVYGAVAARRRRSSDFLYSPKVVSIPRCQPLSLRRLRPTTHSHTLPPRHSPVAPNPLSRTPQLAHRRTLRHFYTPRLYPLYEPGLQGSGGTSSHRLQNGGRNRHDDRRRRRHGARGPRPFWTSLHEPTRALSKGDEVDRAPRASGCAARHPKFATKSVFSGLHFSRPNSPTRPDATRPLPPQGRVVRDVPTRKTTAQSDRPPRPPNPAAPPPLIPNIVGSRSVFTIPPTPRDDCDS